MKRREKLDSADQIRLAPGESVTVVAAPAPDPNPEDGRWIPARCRVSSDEGYPSYYGMGTSRPNRYCHFTEKHLGMHYAPADETYPEPYRWGTQERFEDEMRLRATS